jgi:hypothetical protein
MMAKRKNGQIVESAMEARGAERGPTVRNVLVWSLGLVIVAFAAIYFFFKPFKFARTGSLLGEFQTVEGNIQCEWSTGSTC